MVNSNKPIVSVITPCDDSFQRVKTILFSPFELGKWFAIGFCFFLAYLGEAGSSFNFNGNFGSDQNDFSGTPSDLVFQVKNYFTENLLMISIIASAGFIFIFGLVVLFNWLKSRGQFMSIYNIVKNSSQISFPWSEYAREANSLLIFRVLIWLINTIVIIALIAGCIFFAISQGFIEQLQGDSISPQFIAYLLGFIGIFAVAMLPFTLIRLFLHDFVVPLMFINRCNCMGGWRIFGSILRSNFGKILLYLLFKLLISMAIATITITLCCITCCTFACLTAIPYIGSVATLPFSMFIRCYSMYYLAQYGPEFNAFSYIETEPDTIE